MPDGKLESPVVRDREGAPRLWSYMDGPGRTTGTDAGDVADLMGGHGAGVRVGNTSWVDGPRGKRLGIAGTGTDYASFGVRAVDFAAVTISLRFEIAPGAATGGLFQWADNTPATGDPFILVQYDGSNLRYYFNLNYQVTTPVTTGVPHGLAFTSDGSNWVAYLDGQPVGSYAGGWGYLRANASTIMLGTGYPGSLACRVEDFRLYDRVLGPAEVARDYADPEWRLRPSRSTYWATPAAPQPAFRPWFIPQSSPVGVGVM